MALPDGLKDVSGETEPGGDSLGAFIVETGNILRGTLLDRKESTDRKGQARVSYRVRVSAPCKVRTWGDGAQDRARAGDVVLIDERAQLATLERYVGKEVYIEPTGKRPLGRTDSEGREMTVWEFQIGVRG